MNAIFYDKVKLGDRVKVNNPEGERIEASVTAIQINTPIAGMIELTLDTGDKFSADSDRRIELVSSAP